MTGDNMYAFNENIKIRLAKPEDADEMIEFLLKHFLAEAPLMSSLGVTREEEAPHATTVVNTALASNRPLSFVAVDTSKNNTIVACSISTVLNKEEFNEQKNKHEQLENEILPKNGRILTDFNRLLWSRAFDFLPEDYKGMVQVVDLVSVAPEYQRLHLMKVMGALAARRAYEVYGCRFALASLTSYKSQANSKAMGHQILRRIEYDDYLVNGKKVFEKAMERGHKGAELALTDRKDKAWEKILKKDSKL